jgi:hypothetical protein
MSASRGEDRPAPRSPPFARNAGQPACRFDRKAAVVRLIAGGPPPVYMSRPSALRCLVRNVLVWVQPCVQMDTDRDPGTAVPEEWLAVLDAVAEACAAEHARSASTGRVSVRISGVNRHTARMLLRLLRRRGYLDTAGVPGDGAPLHWTLTPAGRSLRTGPRYMPAPSSGQAVRSRSHDRLPFDPGLETQCRPSRLPAARGSR